MEKLQRPQRHPQPPPLPLLLQANLMAAGAAVRRGLRTVRKPHQHHPSQQQQVALVPVTASLQQLALAHPPLALRAAAVGLQQQRRRHLLPLVHLVALAHPLALALALGPQPQHSARLQQRPRQRLAHHQQQQQGALHQRLAALLQRLQRRLPLAHQHQRLHGAACLCLHSAAAVRHLPLGLRPLQVMHLLLLLLPARAPSAGPQRPAARLVPLLLVHRLQAQLQHQLQPPPPAAPQQRLGRRLLQAQAPCLEGCHLASKLLHLPPPLLLLPVVLLLLLHLLQPRGRLLCLSTPSSVLL